MANWCLNAILARGRPDDLQRMMEQVSGGMPYTFDLQRIVPMPAELEDSAQQRAWRRIHWGVEENVRSAMVLWWHGDIHVRFYSRQRPPIFAVRSLGQQHTGLLVSHQYMEMEQDLSGLLVVENGQLVKNACGDFLSYFFGEVRDYFQVDFENGGKGFLAVLALLTGLRIGMVREVANKYAIEDWMNYLVPELAQRSGREYLA